MHEESFRLEVKDTVRTIANLSITRACTSIPMARPAKFYLAQQTLAAGVEEGAGVDVIYCYVLMQTIWLQLRSPSRKKVQSRKNFYPVSHRRAV